MSRFKSWLVANIEVILIAFTVIFLIITSLIMIPKIMNGGGDSIIDGYVLIVMFSIILCALFVYAVRNGFLAFIAVLFFVGFITAETIKDNKEAAQQSKTGVSAQIQNGESDSDGNELSLFMYEAGKKFEWKWLLWVCIPAAIFGLFTSIYANRYFEDVVSRRFFYRNSNVDVFAIKWKYTFNRFYAGFVTVFTIGLELMLFALFHS